MRIPAGIIERVRDTTDIVGVIAEHVNLVKAGRTFKGLCPFHTEKTPSFIVNPERQKYHCFGCGAGGNVITFLMEFAGMTFPEAVRHLADRQGIEIPRNADDGAREGETTRLYEALEFAAEFFHERLNHPYAGRPAREYLERRGLPEPLAEEFRLGFAPDGWSNLMDVAERKYTRDVLVRAGLLVAKEDGRAYDRFRNRLIVPITNTMGRVVGFGGRVLGDEEPKYLNSPESPVYQKGQILFGLKEAREALNETDTAVVVEGYMDHLRMFGSGFRNVVAVAGTAFTAQQAALLKRFVRAAVFIFDGDRAGETASWRALTPALAAGLDVRLALLPAGHDPDSLIRDEGPEALREVLDTALDPVAFAAERIGKTRGREEALNRIVEVAREVPDPIRRRLLVQNAAEALRFDEATLVRAVESKNVAAVTLDNEGERPLPETDPVERTLIAILIADPTVGETLPDITEDLFQDPLCAEIFRRVLSDSSGRFAADRLLEEESGTAPARLVSRLLVETVDGGERAAADCVHRLKARAANRRISELRSALKAAEGAGDAERSRRLRMEINELKKSTLLTGAKT